jgi:hypothetical protein
VARLIGWLLFLALIGGAYWFTRDYVRRHPQDVPWTTLDLAHPVGAFTGRKIADLSDEPAQCRALVRRAGLSSVPVPPLLASADCGFADGMRIASDDVGFAPAGLVTSCPVAAALHLLERSVIQPAALRRFGSPVRTIDHAGSYSCRRLYGRSEGPFSEHATADAIDITGFRLADGRRISVLHDWQASGAKAAFLRDVRDGSCRLFATVLSPDYNAAHRDHLHLDVAERGAMGFKLCR